ncbi:MAG: YlxR family protein [Clostridia bacterium]|nr:YlxR family protein [Clostridia bacterium]
MAKKVPMRMCVGCREMKPKKELLRIVRSPEGEVSVDRTGKASGRGAYICVGVECLNKAQKTKALERALEHSVSDEVFDRLHSEIQANGQ